MFGQLEAVELLLLEEAPATALNNKNQTCLDLAIEHERLQIAFAIINSKGYLQYNKCNTTCITLSLLCSFMPW